MTTIPAPAITLAPEDGDAGLVWRPWCICGWSSEDTHTDPDEATDAADAHTCPKA